MTYSFGRGIPANSILRQGTLIVGVTKRNPMAPAVQALEEALQKKIAEANGPSQQSTSTARKPDENS
jgi:hypothetical protein